MYIRHPLKTSTIWYVSFHIRVRSVCDAPFPPFKTYAMFVTRIIFHLKRYVCDKHSLLLKTLVMFLTCIKNVRIVRDVQSFSFKMFVMFATQIHIILQSAPRRNYYVLFIYLHRSSVMNL